MNFSAPFIRRPVATSLLTLAVAIAGILAFQFLPVAPLPQVEFPTIQVQAALPGASPETMASAVAMPLERQFGRIAGVTDMTSTSYLGSTGIVLQFDLNRNIDGAARDVQAAINAARGQLPPNLPNNPNYRKVNPADAPIIILALTSDTVDIAHMYDAAASILQQKLAQVEGVGQVSVGGSSLPAVRVDLNLTALNNYGIGLSEVRSMLSTANANRPKGQLADGSRAWEIGTTDQLFSAEAYRPLIVAYRRGAPVRLADVGDVQDDVEDLRSWGLANGKPAVVLVIFRQPGANIIATVERVRARLPELRASIPQAIDLAVVMDRTQTIRDSIREVEITMVIAIALVILVVFVFLRTVRATIIPGVVVPLSLIGTFAVMYLLGYSLDNLSLMALTISTGFVVDDAIVVIENITRYLEQGVAPMQAALRGAREIGFTVLSMSTSLIAVFIPILLMGGIVGRLFREFAVTLSTAIVISLVVSLTTTPMMCAKVLRAENPMTHGRIYRFCEGAFERLLHWYRTSLHAVLRHPRLTLAVAIGTAAINLYLFAVVPKGFFPEQDTGRLMGAIQADQDTSFREMQDKLSRFASIVGHDPAVDTVVAFTGGQSSINTGRMYISLKPLSQRRINATQVMTRLRPQLATVPGASLYLQTVQDIRIGGRLTGAAYQFSLQGDDVRELNQWGPRVLRKLQSLDSLVDVNSNQQNRGLEAAVTIDRETAARLGVSAQMVDEALYDAFGQRQVSTMYTPLNQYHVVMEAAPRFWNDPEGLNDIYVQSSAGVQVPLSAFAHFGRSTTALAVNHQGLFPAITLSFNLPTGVALGDAVARIEAAQRAIGIPGSIRPSFQGAAQAFQASLASEPLLILAALLAVYIVLGILYESYVHPFTILSTLPSAGVGALLALLLSGTDLSVIALIGIILLIGIVKKNAIMMIDFALELERADGRPPEEAIYAACVLRFRPIMMTTMAALFGALPLAVGFGSGAELRRPLGLTIVGGLIMSQALTLYTTPIVYLYLDRFRLWCARLREPRARGTVTPIIGT
ncbi:MAG: multidrug efflux RND transporter permease subunit [Candidatus Binatia bacterium]